VKKINPNGSKTLYVGGIYEVDKASGGSVTRTVTYYPVAGAMRINSTLYYVLKDHLGSASVVTDASGNILGEQRYYPFGETRLTTGTIYTDKLFTGQREITGLGIYHYQARFYSPKLGRFLSADTIVPGYANPQSLNRYSYVINNPLLYIDPSGNIPIDCWGDSSYCSNTTILHQGPSYPSKPKPRRERDNVPMPEGGLECPANHPNCGLGQDCGVGGINNCPQAPTVVNAPYTQVLHPIDSRNVMVQIPIYDFSHHPPTLIGYRTTSYAYDGVHFDPVELLPIPDDALSVVSTSLSAGKTLLKPGLDNLATLGITIVCPECALAYKTIQYASNISDINSAFTFDAHLRTHDVYFYEPLFEMPFEQIP